MNFRSTSSDFSVNKLLLLLKKSSKDVRAKISNIDFFLRLLSLKVDELVMSEM